MQEHQPTIAKSREVSKTGPEARHLTGCFSELIAQGTIRDGHSVVDGRSRRTRLLAGLKRT